MKTKRRDAADHLRSDADVIAYLEAAFEEGDSGVVAAALGDIVRAKGMTKVARPAASVSSVRQTPNSNCR